MTSPHGSSLILPPIPNPQRYAGLYVYDFGTHVSVGYTATEIRMLRESERFRDGKAYQIYRVMPEGGFELRGIMDERLSAAEAICFLRADPDFARRDFDALRQLAARHPLPCAARLHLATIYDFRPPHAVALTYSAASSHAVSAWLNEAAFAGGDEVIGGIDVHAVFITADGDRIEACDLPTLLDYTDRAWEAVEAGVDDALQR